jgi:hypothetical protein
MIAHTFGNGQIIQQYSWHEVLVASGSAETDSEFVQDELITQWLDGRRCVVIETHAQTAVEQAVSQGIEVIIIKEK